MKKSLLVYLLVLSTIRIYAQDKIGVFKPYSKVITKEAVTQIGFIKTHQINNKLYFEIPESILDKEMLFVEYNKFRGKSSHIKWVKKGDVLHLIKPQIVSKVGNIPVELGEFGKKNKAVTLLTFPILSNGIEEEEASYIINAAELFFNTPAPIATIRLTEQIHSGSGLSIYNNLAFINEVLAFHNTIEIKTEKTFMSKDGPFTEQVNFSLFLLPEPMTPRFYDRRMGFGKANDYLDTEMVKAAITRWRLEKKDKNSQICDPIKPITFYFDPETPEKWKPYIKAGVLAWLPAFEAAGFKNAIQIKEPLAEDKDWNINSLRYSFIRWDDRSKYRGKEGEGAGGVNVIIDKRTGEIIKGDILIGNIKGISSRYFIRCSPLDKRAQQYPFPDNLMGELIQSLTSHEAGHVFGLKDGNYGEYAYPFVKMRDKEWLQAKGHTPSIMTYGRENYVVQPEDNLPPQLLQQKVGPTDLYSIRWGYTPVIGAKTAEDELPLLNAIVREQDSIPWYRYNQNGFGPDAMDEVVESNNPVSAVELGIKNLKRVIKLIPEATVNDQSDINRAYLYRETLKLWEDQMKLVASLVGGVTVQHKSNNQKGPVYTPIPASEQKRAMEFLNKEVFNEPLWLLSQESGRYLHLLDYSNQFIYNELYIISSRQKRILQELLNMMGDRSKLKKLQIAEISSPKEAYKVSEFLQDLSIGLWSELELKSIGISPYRKELQLEYIILLKRVLDQEANNKYSSEKYVANSSIRVPVYNELEYIKDKLEKALKKVKDPSTKGHLKLCLKELSEVVTK